MYFYYYKTCLFSQVRDEVPFLNSISVFLQLSSVCESPGDLMKVQILTQGLWSRVLDSAFPMSSQEMSLL